MMPHIPDIAAIFAALGWAVIHFTWQGVVIGLVAGLLLAAARQSSAAMRYAIACAAMACCILAFIVTFALMLPRAAAAPVGLANLDQIESLLQSPSASSRVISAIAWLWVGGVTLCSVRVVLQWFAIHRLKTISVSEPDWRWQQDFERLREQFGVSRAVRLLRSRLAEAPMVVGWIAPVVLVPASAFTSLTPEQLRSILAHELSHIRRCDHLVNAAQIVVETILFYHPVVWWLSRQVRVERENCCDDAAVNAAGNPRILAEALAQLESLRITHPRAALAANGGPLMNRITRLLAKHTSDRSAASHWPGVAVLAAAAVMTAAGLAHATALSSAGDPPTKAEIDAYLETAAQKLQEGIEAGRITSAEANARLDAIQTHLNHKIKSTVHGGLPQLELQDADSSGGIGARETGSDELDLDAAAKHVHAAVLEGKLTPEQAEKLMKGLHQMHAELGKMTDHLNEAAGAIHEAVQAGRMSVQDAEVKLAQLERARTDKLNPVDALANLETKIRSAVEAGISSLEDVKSGSGNLKNLHLEGIISAEDLGQLKNHLHQATLSGKLSPADLTEIQTALERVADEKAAILAHVAARLKEHQQLGADQSEAAGIKGIQAAHEAHAKASQADAEVTAAVRARDARAAAEKARAEKAEAEMTAGVRARDSKAALEISMKNFVDQLKAEVESGDMTVEQARAVLDALKNALGKSDD